MDIIIDPEFRDALPPLEAEELAGLEVQIEATKGPTGPLVVWPTDKGDILIDGHNRYDICTRAGWKFEVRTVKFPDRDHALLWIIAHQMGRRNLNAAQRAIAAIQIIEIRTRLAGASLEDAADGGGNENTDQALDTEGVTEKSEKVPPQEGDTKCASNSRRTKREQIEREVAEETGVGHDTVRKARYVRERNSELARRMIRGDVSVKQAYRQAKASEDEMLLPGEDAPLDTLGNPLMTDTVIHAFGHDHDEIEKGLRLMGKAQTILQRVAKRPHGPGDWIPSKQQVGLDFKNIKRILKHMLPYCVCPACGGKRCPACRDTGWLPKMVYDNLPPEKKESTQ